MMLRKLAVSLALAGILSTSNAYALGLGEIKINSALNEPLDAEIELLDARKLSPLQIQPRMADIDEYVLAGIDKQRFLSDVNFKVFVGPDGKGRIRLTSPNPIKEPFLNFLVELNWPNGRLVREYTLLLDPPVYNPVRQRLAAQPPVQVQPRAVEPVAPAQPVAPVSNIRTEMDRKTQVFVDVHDSLWSIADKYRPDASVTKSQMALALLKKNPDAFVGGNINRMKAGVVLDLPTLDEINTLTPQQAAAEVQRQNQAWKNRNKPVAKPETPAKPLVATVKVKPQPEEPSADVKPAVSEADKPLIVALKPEAEGASGDPAQNEANQKALQELEDARVALEQELEETNAELAALRAQNELLNERLEMMQDQLASIQAALAGKDRTIEALEQRIEEQQAQLAEKEKGFITRLMEDPILLASIGGGLVAILAAVGVILFLRRRKAKKAQEESGGSGGDLAAAAAAGAAAAVAADAVADDEQGASEAGSEAADDASEDIAGVSVDDDMDDLSDLDLDMDLDLDLDAGPVDEVVEESEDDLSGFLEDDEFDLGLDETDGDDSRVDAVAADVIEEDVDDDELEKLLAEDLGDDLAGSSLDLEADLDDADLEFGAGSNAAALDADDLDAILADDDCLEFTPPASRKDDPGLEELGLEDIGLDDLDAPAGEDDALDFNVGGGAEHTEADDTDLEADDIDALLAQVSGGLNVAPEADEDLEVDDIDALLAQASGDLEAESGEAEDVNLANAGLDDLDESVLDADLEALLAETEQIADEAEQESGAAETIAEDDLDIDSLLESVAADSGSLEAQAESDEALMGEETDELDDALDFELDADLAAGSIDDLLAEVAAEKDAPAEPEPEATLEPELDAIDELVAEELLDSEEPDEDVDVLMQDLSDLVLEEDEEESADLSGESDLDALLSQALDVEDDAQEAEASAPESQDDLDALFEAESVAEKATEHLEALSDEQGDEAFDAEVESLLNEVIEKAAPGKAVEDESVVEQDAQAGSDVEEADLELDEVWQESVLESDSIDDILAELELDEEMDELDADPAAAVQSEEPVADDAEDAVESAVEDAAIDEAPGIGDDDLSDAFAELEAPLEVENLDDLDLDLGDMDLADLLDEVATADAEVADAGVDTQPEVSSSVEESIKSALAETPDGVEGGGAESGLEGLEDLDDLDLAEMMAGLEREVADESDLEDVDFDLDADLTALDRTLDELGGKAVPANPVEEELTANIVHDLDAELDSELQSLLDGSDGDIELEESDADEEDLTDIDGWSLLEGADEVETKLDLARAYMDMEDTDGAREILAEIVSEGSDTQKQEASALLESIKQ